jgi:hypothetical protein
LDWRSTEPQSCDDSKSNETVEDSVQDWNCDHPETRPVSECPRWAQKVGQLVTDEGCPPTILRVKHEHLSEAAQNGYQKTCDARVSDRLPHLYATFTLDGRAVKSKRVADFINAELICRIACYGTSVRLAVAPK